MTEDQKKLYIKDPAQIVGKTIKEAFYFRGLIMDNETYLFLSFTDGSSCIIEALDESRVKIFPDIQIKAQKRPHSTRINNL